MATTIIAPRGISLTSGAPTLTSAPVTVPALTSVITLRLLRPTTAVPQAWTGTGKLRVSLVLVIDGAEHTVTGTVSGGIRLGQGGVESPEYVLTCFPAVLGRQGRLLRIGETALAAPTVYVKLERLTGSIGTQLLLCDADEAPAPLFPVLTDAITAESPGPGEWLAISNGTRGFVATGGVGMLGTTEQFTWTDRTVTHLRIGIRGSGGLGPFDHAAGEAVWHRSVAFDAQTSAQENAGDGVLSLTHTATGDNRAAFAGVGSAKVAASLSTSVTYGGAGMTELWDVQAFTYAGQAGYALADNQIPDTAQTVTSTMPAAIDGEHMLGVITLTDVDQDAPTGTVPTPTTGSGGTASITVSDATDDDLIVDCLNNLGGGLGAIGADQTQRFTQDGGSYGIRLRSSTQPGTADDVMSWTTSDSWILGAVAFKMAGANAEPSQVYPFAITQRVG